jgi:prepilin-type N-terminal cleavage/methylation domain-containing protein
MSINPYDSPETPGQAPEKAPGRRKFTLVELLIVIAVIGVLVAMLLPNVRMSREAARRSSCSNNLKQIGIALHNYHDDYQSFPPAYTVAADGKPLHSWRTLILPYLEQKPLYDKIDLSKPWDDPANQAAYDSAVSVYQCPSANAPAGQTTYLAVVAPGSCLQPAKPRQMDEIIDGSSSTLIAMEMDLKRAVHWMSPADASEQAVLSFAEAKPLSHPRGAHGLLADGTIRFFGQDTKP